MRMAFVTMSMPVSASSIRTVCATDPVRFTNVDVQTFLKAITTATATSWTRLTYAVVTAADADADGICDDVDDCVGELDECGICNGPGAIYECGCADIPEGDCDCAGNQLDALGVCGGGCEADADGDGICDNVDNCVGELDACGVCNGPGAVYECGCADIPEGDCDCEGNQPSEFQDCEGNCLQDLDSDGICDDEDDCVDLEAPVWTCSH